MSFKETLSGILLRIILLPFILIALLFVLVAVLYTVGDAVVYLFRNHDGKI